jgi:hypothetical protein
VSEVTSYPTDITYTVTFDYDLPGDRCAIASLSDSLLPPNYFTFPADPFQPDLFWISNPPTGTESKTFTVSINSFDQCASLGGPVQADGSVILTNFVNGQEYWEGDTFDCKKEVVCRPPPKGFGCTLTPGYWKTHSNFGPAPYDDTWAKLPQGASTTFFTSGKTYFEVLWTDSSAGAYFILARAYISAVLNGLAGASTPDEVQAAIEFAADFFATHGPGSALTKAQRGQVIAFAGVLDNYNNGYTGPGHCSE